MTGTESYSGGERRTRDRSRGIVLRRRESQPVEVERRRSDANGIDIAAALELHLDTCTTRRAMIGLLESWLDEAQGGSTERDDGYIGAVEHAIEVMKAAPDPLTAIAVLQRRSES
jgi:hypothetical protein